MSFLPKTLFHLIGTIANVPIARHVPNFCSITEVIELVGIIQTLCLDILILAHKVQIQMILDEVNFRSQQQVLVIMTLLILRFAHKEIRAILPLSGKIEVAIGLS